MPEVRHGVPPRTLSVPTQPGPRSTRSRGGLCPLTSAAAEQNKAWLIHSNRKSPHIEGCRGNHSPCRGSGASSPGVTPGSPAVTPGSAPSVTLTFLRLLSSPARNSPVMSRFRAKTAFFKMHFHAIFCQNQPLKRVLCTRLLPRLRRKFAPFVQLNVNCKFPVNAIKKRALCPPHHILSFILPYFKAPARIVARPPPFAAVSFKNTEISYKKRRPSPHRIFSLMPPCFKATAHIVAPLPPRAAVFSKTNEMTLDCFILRSSSFFTNSDHPQSRVISVRS